MPQLMYDRKAQTIRFDGKNVVDLSEVKTSSEAKLYSKSEHDFGFQTIFQIDQNEYTPFSLDSLSMTPSTFIKTIVENNLSIQGLKCSAGITEVYKYIKDHTLIDIIQK